MQSHGKHYTNNDDEYYNDMNDDSYNNNAEKMQF